MKAYNFPLDYFGVIADVKLMQLTQQSGDRRKRKSALNSLVGIAKMAGAIERKETVEAVGLLVDSAGQIFLTFQVKDDPHVDPAHHKYVPSGNGDVCQCGLTMFDGVHRG